MLRAPLGVDSRSVTALHKDNYENVYCQIVGQKHFVLLPPIAQACVAEKDLSSASYSRVDGVLGVVEETRQDKIPFPTWDPDDPMRQPTPYSYLASPIRVTLESGDMLYLPALWQA